MSRRKHRGPYRVEPLEAEGSYIHFYHQGHGPAKRLRHGWGVVPYRCRKPIKSWWELPADGIDGGDCYEMACKHRDRLNGVGVDGPKKEWIRREWGR